jgi:hypothetical protein
MMIRRIFAGSIVALLLSVSSFAAACDVSCAFAAMNSDCHSQQTESQDLAPGGMKMDGMAMAGMTMPGMASDEDQHAVSVISRLKASHPSIGAMGPCEKQACDNGFAVFAKTTCTGDSHFHSTLAIAETPRGDGAFTLIRGALDDIATYQVRDGIPLHLSLRI